MNTRTVGKLARTVAIMLAATFCCTALAVEVRAADATSSTAPSDQPDSAGAAAATDAGAQHEHKAAGGLGGLFKKLTGDHKQTQQGAPAPSGGTPSGGMDCEQMAQMPGVAMSVESCKQMMGAQQAYQRAASDPAAARPGDESMSCEAIIAELRNQQYVVPDKAKVAEGQQAVNQWRTTIDKQQAEAERIEATETVALDAASTHDTAVQAATAGLVNPHTTEGLEQKFRDENKATGERMAAERKPTEQRVTTNLGNTAADAGQQLLNNPRMARLVQLADQKRCRGAQH